MLVLLLISVFHFSEGGVYLCPQYQGWMLIFVATCWRFFWAIGAEIGYKHRYIFQLDYDPKHKSRKAKDLYKTRNVNVLEWPAQSTDFNPIKHLWDNLERQVYQVHYSSISNFKYAYKTLHFTVDGMLAYVHRVVSREARDIKVTLACLFVQVYNLDVICVRLMMKKLFRTEVTIEVLTLI